jgi:GNAT superfamily N-acetyltransferase
VTTIRSAVLDDLDQLYAISLATGHLGSNASHLYNDPKLMGHIYSAPYLRLSPETCFVARDDMGIAGFIVGAIDTHHFERRLEREWWPHLRAQYSDPDETERDSWTADQRRSFMIHHPEETPEAVIEAFPSHLHMQLLPRIQGRGIGVRLLDLWLGKAREKGAVGVHVGVNSQNRRAVKFWKRNGFKAPGSWATLPPGRTVWLGRHI